MSDPPRMTVTSTALNAERWSARCLESVCRQTFPAWRHIYVDANSDDETVARAREARGLSAQTEIRACAERLPVLANLVPLWRALPDDEVIVWLDGDDWLATDHALAIVAEAYQAGAWLTYGQFMWHDGSPGFAARVGSNPRAEPWRATHLKTFRAGLVKRIRDFDLHKLDGDWCDLAIDQAVMLPMLEMAAERAVFIDRTLYVYNAAHSFMQHASEAELARERAEVSRIRRLSLYPRLTRPPW